VAELRTQLTALEASAAVTKEDAASLKSLTKEVEAAEKALRAAQAAAEKPAAVVRVPGLGQKRTMDAQSDGCRARRGCMLPSSTSKHGARLVWY